MHEYDDDPDYEARQENVAYYASRVEEGLCLFEDRPRPDAGNELPRVHTGRHALEPPPADKGLLTIAEAAKLLRVSRRTLFRLIKDGRVPPPDVRVTAKLVLYTRDRIQAAVALALAETSGSSFVREGGAA